MNRSGLLLTAVLLAAGVAEADDEKARLEQRLSAERATLEALQAAEGTGLALLDSLELITRDSTAKVAALEVQLKALGAQVALAQRLEGLSELALKEQLRRLSPRLRAMYRGTRQDRLGFLLSAADFATLMRRSRGMRELVRQDVAMLEEAKKAARYQRASARQLKRLRANAQIGVAALKREVAASQARKAAFEKVLDGISSGTERSEKIIGELEDAEARLAAMVSQLPQSPTQEFRAQKGHLPYPTKGLIEVGFGKVVNPKFNTVTVQKGVDFRVREGSPVVAVAKGTVAFAGWLKGYGNLVILDHGGSYHSLSAHLGSVAVETGTAVAAGAELGKVGDTGSLKGPYLYFEIRRKGQAIDPARWLDEDATFE
ncbi:MAG: murein hydrolase activator EnvC family protein [Myxococcaceae bacterium]